MPTERKCNEKKKKQLQITISKGKTDKKLKNVGVKKCLFKSLEKFTAAVL